MAYTIEDLCKEFGSEGKPKSRVTIWRWVRDDKINKPDVKGAHPLWLTLPVKSSQTTSPSA